VARPAGEYADATVVLFLKNLLFTVLVPGTVAVLLPWRLASARLASRPPTPTDWLIAAPAFLAGASIYFWCLWDFGRTGRGTPAPIDPPTTLVVRGLYRYVRNPMYVGVLLVIVGWTVLTRSPNVAIYGASVAMAFHLFVVFVEEPMLRARFGESYGTYCRSVSRWWPTLRA
jgi:protein-S-isoprenylcysteine O-methyltransferase Ste14